MLEETIKKIYYFYLSINFIYELEGHMNIHGLRLFHQVAQTGSFTKAAELLRISQPAVSSQIKKFEYEIGIPLFKQQGRGVILTEFGEELAEKAKSFFHLKDISNHSLKTIALPKQGQFI